MRKLGTMVGLALVAIACATGGDMVNEMLDSGVPDAGAETPGDGSSMQLVGFSEQTFRGERQRYDESNGNSVRDEHGNDVKTGIFDYYAACQETFGPGTRTCTADEIKFTTDIPQLSGLAWYGIGEGCRLNSGSSCGSRSAVRDNGQLVSARCCTGSGNSTDAMLPVACCGPK